MESTHILHCWYIASAAGREPNPWVAGDRARKLVSGFTMCTAHTQTYCLEFFRLSEFCCACTARDYIRFAAFESFLYHCWLVVYIYIYIYPLFFVDFCGVACADLCAELSDDLRSWRIKNTCIYNILDSSRCREFFFTVLLISRISISSWLE